MFQVELVKVSTTIKKGKKTHWQILSLKYILI